MASVLDYDDPVPDAIALDAPLTADMAHQLAQRGVTAIKAGPAVPPATLVHLASIPTLRGIDLSFRADLTDDDVAFLERMPGLTAVSLARCAITDRAVEGLRHHQQLERVNLQWTKTGDRAVDALTGKRALSRFLAGAHLSDAGARRLSDFPALAVAGARDAFLSVSSARLLTDAALEAIGDLRGVVALDLNMSAFGSPHYTARGLAHLRRMPALEELNVHGALCTDEALAAVAGIPALRWLHAQDPVCGDEGFVALGACTTLQNVAMRVCRRMTDRGFAAIAGLPRLTALSAGGPRVSDEAMAHLADAPALVDLGPIMFGDDAFRHIARIPALERLGNMYNRATTDAATRHLRGHRTLVHYSAFGTQITDDSLRVLATCEQLASLEFENCYGITDAGLRELLRLPRLKKVTAWACPGVAGEWLSAVPPGVEASSAASGANQMDGYRAETLLDYPDLPMYPDARAPRGTPPADGLLGDLRSFGIDAAFGDDGLRASVPPGTDIRWIALVTSHAWTVPLRVDVVVRPVSALRLYFGGHNRSIALDQHGRVADPAPWFMKTTAQRGTPHGADAPAIPETDWTTVAIETTETVRRLFVDGTLRHTWTDDYAAVRSRIGIGALGPALEVRDLRTTVIAARDAGT